MPSYVHIVCIYVCAAVVVLDPPLIPTTPVSTCSSKSPAWGRWQVRKRPRMSVVTPPPTYHPLLSRSEKIYTRIHYVVNGIASDWPPDQPRTH